MTARAVEPRRAALEPDASRPRLRRIDLRADDPGAWLEIDRLAHRGAVPDRRVRDSVKALLDEIRAEPEPSLRRANERFGGGLADGRLTLEADELRAARDGLPDALRAALEAAIANVRRFAETQRPVSNRLTTQPGVEIERRWLPVARVGCYVPGGSAAYPSSLLMTAVPAQVAGVGTIVVASPAGRDGRVDPVLMAAAGLLDVDVFVVAGGAQAIGALAFGLPSIGLAAVDTIVGPGNAYVTAAKLELAGEVGIDLPAGPSEGCVIADPSADPAIVAADLLTQAEHGPDSPAILVTPDPRLADDVEAEIERALVEAPRAAILRTALERHGRIVLTADLDAAIDVVNRYAPEHLSLDVADADLEWVVERVRSAGSVFVGRWAPESAGDYATGANHVLPTGGLARSLGPLSVETFGRYSQVQRVDREGLGGLRGTIEALASAEGLVAHRRAVEVRFERAADGAADESRMFLPDQPDESRTPAAITPVTFSSPVAPASYSWEATSEAVAERYGLGVDTVLRFDLNTSPRPPRIAAEVLAAGRYDVPLSEYPPSDYRRLVAAAAATYGCRAEQLLVGAGADEILDICAKAFLGSGEGALIPTPSYAMYRVLTEQRGARVISVPRRSDAGFRVDPVAVRVAARDARLIWLCDPNNPTAQLETPETIEGLLAGLAADAAVDGRPAPIVVIDEAYAEFSGRTWLPWLERYPRLVIVRTLSKAYALAGLRVGFAIARRDVIEALAPYRPPGSVAVPSIAVGAAALESDGAEMRANVAAIAAERERLGSALADLGWAVAPSVTNFLLVNLGSAARADAVAEGFLRRGLVPRTFPAGHPLASCLRITVRTRDEDDRLIEAARALGPSVEA